jgi:transcriptional regulator with XRE-family HTH domain
MAELTIGERIRELRRGIFTQHDLAAAADVSVDVIRKLEQGRRLTASIGTLQRPHPNRRGRGSHRAGLGG